MTPRTSPSWRVSRRFASVPACTSARPARAGCTTWSTRSSTTPSTRRWPAATTLVEVTIHPDNSVTVVDNGAGIPVGDHGEGGPAGRRGRPHRPARRRQVRRGGGYKVSGGLHGVGVSVVNALSEQLHVEVRRDGFTWTQDFVRGVPQADLAEGRADEGDRHDDHVPAGRRDLRDAGLRFRDARAAPARDRVPDPRPAGSAIEDERGEGNRKAELPLRGRDRGLRRVPEREQGPDPEEGRVLRGRLRRGRGRGRAAVELLLPGVRLLVRQQHQHARGRLAPLGLPLGADAHAQPLRARDRRAQGEGREPLGRGRPRGPDGGDLGQADRPAVRGPDEDQARQPGHGGLRRLGRQPQARAVPRGEPARRRARSSARPSRPRRRARPRARRATSRASRRSSAPRCRASSPTARSRTRR